ncbi:HAD-IA family hydrolase [candidate division KSB3 bacterium]|uniref:HAD-IA family hydrolase n=1 Tax=candidate division KSB3 bacterium TaxID=2044937 RepID=A0A9D5Q4K4_9BACT|nr:HAD-IA family hydrolase [candidate division KSB3 bacterium]MBD3323368.1 HAD-IA family hydrolase [candidate division KSB3 bacterium]
MKSYTHYLFDADGTLLDTAELIYQAFKYSCRKFMNKDLAFEAIKGTIGLPIRKMMDLHLEPMSDERYASLLPEHMQYQRAIRATYLKLFPGVAEGLTALKAQGKHLAVVSSRGQETLKLYLQETGIYDLFDAVISPECTTHHKPHPEPALTALDMLKGKPENALFIGDAEFDIECGTRAGMDTAFVLWSHNPPETLKIQPTLLLKTFGDLVGENATRGDSEEVKFG